jgi:membrane-associated phospholipid phosphatase
MSHVSQKETIIVITASILFLLFQWFVVGLIPAQILMVVLFNLLFFIHPLTRKLALTLLPFVLFEMSYDWMRLFPNYRVNAVDIQDIYEAEKALFGISTEAGTLIPCEYFNIRHHAAADLLSGLFYLCWVPGPIALAVWLFFMGERQYALRFTWAFLFVNIVGFMGYYLHPTAPPWYAINYGFEPDFNTPGNVAGLARFDELIGIPVFSSIYVNNSNIFAAVPSLHAAYMLVATIYAGMSRQPKWLITTCAIITIGIWWTAVYSNHHYVIDVLLGILTAVIGVTLFEGIIRIPACKRFVQKYTNYISS